MHSEEEWNCMQGLVRKPRGEIPLGRTRRGWEDNITVDLKDTGRKGVDWIDLALDRNSWWVVVNKVKKCLVKQGNFLTS
jgi:hypothetical protein